MASAAPKIRGRGSTTYRTRSRSRDPPPRDFDDRVPRHREERAPPRQRDDRFQDDDDDRGSGGEPNRFRESRGDDPRWKRSPSPGGRSHLSSLHARSALQPDGGRSWRHDMFEGPAQVIAGRSDSSFAADDDALPFDPYAVVRQSKAYLPDLPAPRMPDHPTAGRAFHAGAASDRDTFAQTGFRARSRSPRPSHDDYEWKSLAGGVAIFVKKKAADLANEAPAPASARAVGSAIGASAGSGRPWHGRSNGEPLAR